MDILLDGFGPLPFVRPHSVADLGGIVGRAAAAGEAIYPLGGRTHELLGNPPAKHGTALDLRGLSRVIDFPARDMTITGETGITMQALREVLAPENLRLPNDVSRADLATLGGVIAANISGPRRYGFGTLRDYVIGISGVNDEGREFKAGGRVVKNVAGYDLCKPFVGSLGTLGILTQATLKLRPLAEQQAIFSLQCQPDRIEDSLTRLHMSSTRPVILDVLNSAAARAVFAAAGLATLQSPWVILVGYEANHAAVGWQVQQLARECSASCPLDVRMDFAATPLIDSLIEASAVGEIVFKANVLPSFAAPFCLAVDREPNPPALHAHAGNGIVYGRWPPGLTLDEAAAMLNHWRALAAQSRGSVVAVRCPSQWKGTLNVWGPAAPDVWLMREIKAKFDPKRIFNPGRFIDGI